MDKITQKKILCLQKNEITEYHIYSKLAKKTPNKNNKKILSNMAADELRHYKFWKTISNKELNPSSIRIFFYMLLSNIFGLSFGLKLMERGEKLTGEVYKSLGKKVVKDITLIQDEHRHEETLLDMLKEERVEYAGSIVLGLNDALVELTGALAGLTFALQDSSLVAIAGFITGFAASLSMAASSFLASREETDTNNSKNPTKAAIYTGISYIVTVILLILPYLILSNVYISLALTLTIGIIIIASYTYYISTVKNLNFWRRFLEMAGISLSVALISFGVGFIIRTYLGIEV